MTVSIKITVLWYVMSCSLVDEQRSFVGSYCLHHQSRKVSYPSMYLTNNMVSHSRRPLSEGLPPWESQIYNSKITVFSALNWSSYIVFWVRCSFYRIFKSWGWWSNCCPIHGFSKHKQWDLWHVRLYWDIISFISQLIWHPRQSQVYVPPNRISYLMHYIFIYKLQSLMSSQ